MKNLKAAVDIAMARVDLNERKVADADSLIHAGKKMIAESKAEAKKVDSDSRKLEKDYTVRSKSLIKLTRSKEKSVSDNAKSELRTLETWHKAGNRALESRLREALKKQTAGISNIRRGKTARQNAVDALKVSSAALKAAQAKFDAAAGASEVQPAVRKKEK